MVDRMSRRARERAKGQVKLGFEVQDGMVVLVGVDDRGHRFEVGIPPKMIPEMAEALLKAGEMARGEGGDG